MAVLKLIAARSSSTFLTVAFSVFASAFVSARSTIGCSVTILLTRLRKR